MWWAGRRSPHRARVEVVLTAFSQHAARADEAALRLVEAFSRQDED